MLIGCAGQLPPPGGEPDRTPPQIVYTEPDTNAVRVETDRVLLEFSEYVDRRSVEQSIFISPWPGEVEYDWSGREVAILFPSPLKLNRTYVVSVGTDVIDRRERNRMAAGFSLAFSTGDAIDRGLIAGRIYDEKPDGIMVFAYPLGGSNPDTLNPSTTKPEYVTQTGKDGRFTLSNLALGSYRVIAVRDEFRDFLYGRQIDQFGVPTGDVRLDSAHLRVEGLRIRMSAEDTSRPFLTSALQRSRHLIEARFSEPLDSASIPGAVFTVSDTVTGRPMAIAAWFRDPTDPARVLLSTAETDTGGVLRLRAAGLTDRAGNRLDSANASALFGATSLPDTTPPGFSVIGIADSARGIPPREPVRLVFTEPVETTAVLGGITIADTSRKSAPFAGEWRSPVELMLRWRLPLQSRMHYDIGVVLDSLRDLRGNARHDSTAHVRFVTQDTSRTGSIEGWVMDTTGRGDVILEARQVEGGQATVRTVRLLGPGSFTISEVPEGRYALSAFRDEDSSGAYSAGLPFPFRPSEPFVVYQDTVKVRARWGVEGVTLRIR